MVGMFKLLMAMTIMSTLLFSHPLVSVKLSENSVKQGEALWVKINTSKRLKSGHIKLDKYQFKLFNKNKAKKTFLSSIGVSRYAKPKNTRIYFSFVFEDDSEYQTSLPFTILDANFKKEHIKLPPKKQKIKKDKKSRTNENVIISKKFKTISNRKKYEGNFIWPLKVDLHLSLVHNAFITIRLVGSILASIYPEQLAHQLKQLKVVRLF